MTRTSWSRSSKLLLACVVLLSAFAAAATPAAAISVDNADVPEEGEVGTQVTATVTLTELYKDPQLEQWDLAGETELTDVTWTVTFIDQTGAKVGQESYDGQSFDGATIAASDGTAEVEVRVRGTVPDVDEYTYDPAQSFTLVTLEQTRQGGNTDEIRTWEAHHFTEESDEARTALDEAQTAIQRANAAGASTGEAQRTFENAVRAYEDGSFDLATDLANEAESKASGAQQSSQLIQYGIYGAVGLVVVGLLVGGFLYWRSQQDSYDKLG